MATFELTGPDGGTYHVDAPDEAAALSAFHSMNGGQPKADVSIPEDVAKSAGIGAVKGTIGMLGMPGDAGSLIGAGVDKAGSALGVGADKVQMFKDLMKTGLKYNPMTAVPANLLQGPSSGDLTSSLESVTGPLYQPKTVPGEYAQTAGEFLPAMIGGPEGIGAKLLTRVAAPAIASETAGQLTKGTAAEPYAKVAGALVGGVGASAAARKFQAMAAARNAASATPTAENLLSTAGKQFEDVKSSDLVIKPAAVENMAKDIKTELLNDGFHPDSGNQKGVFSALDRLEAMGTKPGGVTPKDMEVIRKNLVSAKADIDGSTAKAARDATNSFMEKYSNLGTADVLNGDAQKTFGTLKEAIGNYAAGKRSNTVMGKVALGNLNAETAGSGANVDNALRQAVKQLVRPVNNDIMPKAQRLGFNKAEIEALNTAARGTTLGNAARYVGKAAPTGIVSAAMSGSAGHLAGGPIGAVAFPAVGYIAKKIGDLSTKRAVAAVDSLVRSRSPLAAQVAAQLPAQITRQLSAKTQALLMTLVASDPILSKQASQPVGQPSAN